MNVDYLIKPISMEAPTGSDVRQSAKMDTRYQRIKDARAEARMAERRFSQGLAESDLSKSHWEVVFDEAQALLEKESKDLEVAAWLCEASLRLHGFSGLNAAFLLVQQLVDTFWGDLFPNEDGLETTLAPLVGLNGLDGEGTLIKPIKNLAITANPAYAIWQQQHAQRIESLAPAEKQRELDHGAITLTQFNQAVSDTPESFFNARQQHLAATQESYNVLIARLDELAGELSPPCSQIKAALADYQKALKPFISHCIPEPRGEIMTQSEKIPQMTQLITSRKTALNALLEVAHFFRSTEPHSPLPYLLDQAIRWGNLPLHELLVELINDEGIRSNVFKLTGISQQL